MTNLKAPANVALLYERAQQFCRAGQPHQAEAVCEEILDLTPGHVDAALMAARLATTRGKPAQAAAWLRTAFDQWPGNTELGIQLSLALAASGQLSEALAPLEQTLRLAPDTPEAWLFLGLMHDRLGDAHSALQSAYQAVTRAQRAGRWLDEATTPPELFAAVVQAIERVRNGRRELYFGSFAELRVQYGSDALKRLDRALAGHLKELSITPPHAGQRPKSFYFPDLPSPAYHDPQLQPWSARLSDAFPDIRAEALAVIREDQDTLPNFIQTPNAAAQRDHLAGQSAMPTWQAFFFYRHGRRFADNHARCPITSAVLESLDLHRIPDEAPEICFSVLRPGTDIKPHHGVSNTRLVMHLPLIVPKGCALNVSGGGVHEWVEGELVMFDDTFLHEAWNRSSATRVILLMDCWNPYLTAVERMAYSQLVVMMSSLKPKTTRVDTTA